MNKSYQFAAVASAVVVIAVVLASLVPLAWLAFEQGGTIEFGSYVISVLQFTILQAGLSTVLSIVVAIPAAGAIADRQFIGRDILLAIFAVPQMLPAIVLVLALTGVFGRSGWFPDLFNIYGLTGILLAHAFYNVPLCIRLFVEALQSVSPENRRLAEQLGMDSFSMWRHVDWPALKTMLPRAAALVFLYCTSSFVIVLTFGGPAATTLEVAIYQSLRLDFDLARAMTFSLLQLILCLLLVGFSGTISFTDLSAPSNQFTSTNERSRPISWFRILALLLPVMLIVPPLLQLLGSGFAAVEWRWLLLQAFATSLAIAVISASVAVFLAWILAAAVSRQVFGTKAYSTIAVLGIIVPPAVLATGWFVLLRNVSGNVMLSAALICLLNSMMALPLVFAILSSAMRQRIVAYDQLSAQLGINGWRRFVSLDYPQMRNALLQSFLMAGVLSLGDLTAVMMLGSQGLVTLPSLIASEMGNYRSSSAQGTALLLAAICFAAALWATQIAGARRISS